MYCKYGSTLLACHGQQNWYQKLPINSYHSKFREITRNTMNSKFREWSLDITATGHSISEYFCEISSDHSMLFRVVLCNVDQSNRSVRVKCVFFARRVV